MSDASRSTMIAAYIQESMEPPGFFSAMFRTPPENYYNSEEVEIDIQRNGEDIAIAVQDLSVKGRKNEATLYTNKKFKPPIFDEQFPIRALDGMSRQIGQNPFESVDFMESAFRSMRSNMRRGEQMIRRSIELQASQVMQTGTSTLTDSTGATVYSINFAPKADHFADAGTSWASSTAKLADIEALADLVRTNGHTKPNQLIFGGRAWARFKADAAVLAQLDTRRVDLGMIQQPLERGGGKYHGTLTIAQDTFELWTYQGWYKDPQTGTATEYMHTDKVIVRGPGRLDLTFGAIPQLVPPDPRVAPLVFNRVSGAGMDMFTHAWLAEDERSIIGSIAARPLCIPTAIDTFACLNTVPA